MDILEPKLETPQPTQFSEELPSTDFNLRQLETLQYFGEEANPETLEKIDLINKYASNNLDLEKLSSKIGETRINKLDALYSYVKLLEMEAELSLRQDLIRKEKSKWEVPQQYQN